MGNSIFNKLKDSIKNNSNSEKKAKEQQDKEFQEILDLKRRFDIGSLNANALGDQQIIELLKYYDVMIAKLRENQEILKERLATIRKKIDDLKEEERRLDEEDADSSYDDDEPV